MKDKRTTIMLEWSEDAIPLADSCVRNFVDEQIYLAKTSKSSYHTVSVCQTYVVDAFRLRKEWNEFDFLFYHTGQKGCVAVEL